ncbi:phospholipase/carboxylesterase [Cyclobacterium lianum]|uniref:Phospholipase/carboxylesterase n=1 Tax=Cyclobacterium lianum TaxID=388280 RepID=A0A1M7PJA5_9BACT|nr:dienelactone hydrolase family protein [Cyclobacterium lianum]SHN17082.1 phospholipase/carboxylesterase [Cyclobacterium lianum]
MEELVSAGRSLRDARKIAILIHGRGANAAGMLGVADALAMEDFALLAPQAPGNTWYPFGFMVPESENEPYLSRSLKLIENSVQQVLDHHRSLQELYFVGFSQGACLALEYVARHPSAYGGVIAFTGGLIGQTLAEDRYQGDLRNTPVFIGAGRNDFHVPFSRIEATDRILGQMGARVKVAGFDDRLHSIREDEIDMARQFVLDFG